MNQEAGTEYEFIIVGSGLGGLACAYILASEGKSVLVLEKNHQIGGNLQVYSRDKTIFDTGVHYIGGMNPGENLYQFFKYFGILDDLKLKKLDEDRFDTIRFEDGKEYHYAQGHEAFKKRMIEYFPEETVAIETFSEKVLEICSQFPLYNLRTSGNSYQYNEELMQLNAHDYIASITSNERLRGVLAGSNLLYAGDKEKTPFYVHALIINSYLSGSYKLVDGGSQLAILLSRQIRRLGGKILKREKIVSAEYDDAGHITAVVSSSGNVFRGKEFISNVHPAVTIDIFGEERFLKIYNSRIRNLENSISTFLVHISFKENTFPYLNYNIYQHHIEDVWEGIHYNQEIWPETYFICTPASSKSEIYADSMSVMTYMSSSETEKWSQSSHTIAEPGTRDQEYYEFKLSKQEQVLKNLEKVFPDIRSTIKSVHSATPLTFRDYIGNQDGSLYGIKKNSASPARSQINTRTRIPNLHLTGQNVSLHGILGVTVSAFVTCFSFLDRDKLVEKVKNA